MEESHARTVEALKADSESSTKQVLNELQSKYDALLEEKKNTEDASATELAGIRSKCETLVEQLSDAEKKLEESTAQYTATEKAHAEALEQALETQRQKIEQKYVALLEQAHADTTKLEQEKNTTLAEKQSVLDEYKALESELHAQIDDLKHALAEKEEIDAAGLVEVSKKYEILLAEQSAADKEAHEAAIEDLRKSLREEYELAKQEAYTELEILKDELASKEKSDSAGLAEVTEKYESLLAEQSAADKRDYEATMALYRDSADTDLNEMKERYEALLAEKSSLNAEFERAKDEAYAEVDELRRELTAKDKSGAAAFAEVAMKYDTLVAEKSAADEAHEAALSSLKRSLESEREQAIAELQSQNSALQEKVAKMDEEHQQTLHILKKELEGHSTDSEALRQQLESVQKQHTDAIEQMVKAHEDAISELMVGMQNSAADAVQQLQRKYDALGAELEALKANHVAELEAIQQDGTDRQHSYNELQSRFDKAVADLEASSEDVKRLQDTIQAIEAERDRAYKAAVEAEDRIETFKGEVVRKHLARVEPLQKENTALLNKIDRLQDMLMAGDRIARAAASMGEKREINTLAEESEEEQNSSASGASGDSPPPIPPKAPLRNGAAKDVVGTVSHPNCLNRNVSLTDPSSWPPCKRPFLSLER
jgi:chromosome segregation ATPase